jgi:hypothetical protein
MNIYIEGSGHFQMPFKKKKRSLPNIGTDLDERKMILRMMILLNLNNKKSSQYIPITRSCSNIAFKMSNNFSRFDK